jgi:phage repressor protein C with HTH and peptisase S24 domain
VPSAELLRSLEPLRRAVLVPELAIAAGAGAELWAVECTTTVDVPPELPRARYLALEVVGASMEPLIHSGDLVLVRVDETAVPGTVVVARDPDHGYVVKEVGRLTAHGIELRSLNAAFPPLLVPHSAGVVLGTVVLRWARHGS